MEQLQSLSLGRKLILAGGVLLLIDTFLAWQKVSFSAGGVEFGSATANGWHGFWGVLLGLMTVAIVAWVIARMFGVEMPEGIPEGVVALALGGLILLFAVLKNLIDDYSAWASYLGIVLAAVIAYGAWLNFQQSGESLPSMRKAVPAGGTATPPASVPPSADEPPAGNDAT
jgi:hypothetical protein